MCYENMIKQWDISKNGEFLSQWSQLVANMVNLSMMGMRSGKPVASGPSLVGQPTLSRTTNFVDVTGMSKEGFWDLSS